MSTPDQTTNGGTQNANGDQSGNSPDQNNQQTNEHDEVKDPQALLRKSRELLAQNAKLKADLKTREDAAAALELEKLEATGKKDELIAALKKQNAEAETARKQDAQKFASKSVKDQLLAAALKMGADKPELVLKLADVSGIEIGDDFVVNKDQLSAALAKIKEEVPALFKKQMSAPRDGNPGGFQADGQKDYSKYTLDQLKAEFIKTGSQQK